MGPEEATSEDLASAVAGTDTPERRSVPVNTLVLLAARLVAAGLAIGAGVTTYPTGHLGGDASAVPLALITVGAMLVLHALLDVVFYLVVTNGVGDEQAPSPASPVEGYRSLVGVLVATPATVLGLVAAFTPTMTTAVRVGAVALVAAIVIGLLLSTFVVFEASTPGALGFLSWVLSVEIAVGAFGLACIGYAVAFR